VVFDEAAALLCAPVVEFVVGSAQAVRVTAVVAMVRAARIFVVCMVMFLGICIAGGQRY
jgi:hypothetical protein